MTHLNATVVQSAMATIGRIITVHLAELYARCGGLPTRNYMISHEYDHLIRVHRILVTADEVERMGYRVKSDSIPPEILGRVGRTVTNHQFKFRNAADDMRLKHFKKKYGPWFTYGHLPQGNFDAEVK